MLIIGTIVGAGLASGQEIVVFFAQYGFVSVFFIVPIFLIFFFGVKQFLCFGANGYAVEFKDNKGLKIFENLSFAIFVIVSASMLAGANELLSQTIYNFGFPVWSLILIVISTLIINFGIKGLLNLNFWLVPIIIFGIIFVCIKGTSVSTLSSPAFSTDISSLAILSLSSISYCSFNLVTANKVLSDSGANLSKKQAKSVALVVAFVISALIGVIIVSILINDSAILYANLPLVYLSFLINKPIGVMFSLVLFFSIITTIFSAQYSIVNLLSSSKFFKEKNGRKVFSSILSALLILCVSFLGFGKIIEYAYPIVGAIGFVMFFHVRSLSLKSSFNSANNKIHSSR